MHDETHTYLYGNMRLAQIPTSSQSSYEYFLTDALGSVRQLIDETGELMLSQAYQPYGEPMNSSGSGTSPYGFAGEYTDSQTGLQYLRARDYAPGVGRFLTKDAWAGDYARPLTLNRWNYVGSNPINRTDPSGQCYEPLAFLRNIPVEQQICVALDQSLFIYAWPGSTPGQRTGAAAYIGGWAFSHSAVLVGAGIVSVDTLGVKAIVGWALPFLLLSSSGCIAPPPTPSYPPQTVFGSPSRMLDVNKIKSTLQEANVTVESGPITEHGFGIVEFFVANSIKDIAAKVGGIGRFRNLIGGGTSISVESYTCHEMCGHKTNFDGTIDLEFTSSVEGISDFSGSFNGTIPTITHEFGHVINYASKMYYDNLPDDTHYVPVTWANGASGQDEHFASVFTSWVYETYYGNYANGIYNDPKNGNKYDATPKQVDWLERCLAVNC